MSKTPRILAIESSSARLSLAVGTGDQVLKTYQGPLQWRHAEILFQVMERLLHQAGWTVQSLTGVVASIGPGSFTGIRIGLAAARALGQGLGIPVAGESSLKIIASGILQPGEQGCILIDALRSEVFTAIYRKGQGGSLVTIAGPSRMPIAVLARKLKAFRNEALTLAGDAASLYKGKLQPLGKRWHFSRPERNFPQAGELLKLTARRVLKSRSTTYQSVIPLYLRSAAAVERKRG